MLESELVRLYLTTIEENPPYSTGMLLQSPDGAGALRVQRVATRPTIPAMRAIVGNAHRWHHTVYCERWLTLS